MTLLVNVGVERAVTPHTAPASFLAEAVVSRKIGGRYGVYRWRKPAILRGTALEARMWTLTLRISVPFDQLCKSLKIIVQSIKYLFFLKQFYDLFNA